MNVESGSKPQAMMSFAFSNARRWHFVAVECDLFRQTAAARKKDDRCTGGKRVKRGIVLPRIVQISLIVANNGLVP